MGVVAEGGVTVPFSSHVVHELGAGLRPPGRAQPRRVTLTGDIDTLVPSAVQRVGRPNQFLHARGIQQFGVYHPADRFWTFQLIEAALLVAVAA
jgi:hypothetical protein